MIDCSVTFNSHATDTWGLSQSISIDPAKWFSLTHGQPSHPNALSIHHDYCRTAPPSNRHTTSELTSFPSFAKLTPSRTSMRTFSFCSGPIPPPLNGLCQFSAPSSLCSFSFFAAPLSPRFCGADDDPHSPLNPPTEKLDAMTRWQGIRGAKGLLRSAPPTERGEPAPRAALTSLYVETLPAGIVRMRSYTAQW